MKLLKDVGNFTPYLGAAGAAFTLILDFIPSETSKQIKAIQKDLLNLQATLDA